MPDEKIDPKKLAKLREFGAETKLRRRWAENLKRAHAEALSRFMQDRTAYLECLAAAFMKETGLDPRTAVLCEQTTNTEQGQVVRWWFQERVADAVLPEKEDGDDSETV